MENKGPGWSRLPGLSTQHPGLAASRLPPPPGGACQVKAAGTSWFQVPRAHSHAPSPQYPHVKPIPQIALSSLSGLPNFPPSTQSVAYLVPKTAYRSLGCTEPGVQGRLPTSTGNPPEHPESSADFFPECAPLPVRPAAGSKGLGPRKQHLSSFRSFL